MTDSPGSGIQTGQAGNVTQYLGLGGHRFRFRGCHHFGFRGEDRLGLGGRWGLGGSHHGLRLEETRECGCYQVVCSDVLACYS